MTRADPAKADQVARSSVDALDGMLPDPDKEVPEPTYSAMESVDGMPMNCARYSVKLSKPLGLVLEESKDGSIYVAEVLQVRTRAVLQGHSQPRNGPDAHVGVELPPINLTRSSLRAPQGGNAERSGEISQGDVLVSTSAYITTTEQKYGETWVRGGEQRVKLATRGESFDAVMAAIGSHKVTSGGTVACLRLEGSAGAAPNT